MNGGSARRFLHPESRVTLVHKTAGTAKRGGEAPMNRPVLLFCVSAMAMLAWPAFAADLSSEMFNFRWGKNAFNFEGMPTGPQPLRNLSRLPDGSGNPSRLVGDYNNPILTPEAAAIVKQKGELAAAGIGFPNAQEQCRAIAPPFSGAITLGFKMLPSRNGEIVIISDYNADTRHIRMNTRHPAHLKPTPVGDSIGRWEGDTLVIDTVGVKVDRFVSVDRFGTPQTEAMHIVERYRLIDGVAAKKAREDYETHEEAVGAGARNPGYDPDVSLKGLQLDITMEDPKVFKSPLTARVTYRRLIPAVYQENVCADNPVEYYKDEWIGLPRSDSPDF
jgi:hypothetical protein